MSALKYPKIDSLFNRKDDFSVDEESIRRPEFLIPTEWIVTEKIDGMNIRVSLEQELPKLSDGVELHGNWQVKYYGRNENSQFPPQMLEHLQETFTLEKMQSLWRCKDSCECLGEGVIAVDDGPNTSECGNKASQPLSIEPCLNLIRYQIVLYGEGYGAGIQKGGGYNKEKTFRLFDVLIGETWLSRENVEDVAKQLDIRCVPLYSGPAELDMIVEYVRTGLESKVAEDEGEPETMAEGIVAFTDPPLYNGRGQRLQWKLKTKDFVAGKM